MAALTLAIALVMAQGLPYGSPAGPIYSQAPSTGSSPYAFFEFAPSSGAGMGTACACGTVTGAKGEAVTFTRASSAYCTKEGLATTGLTTTSMVLCGTNQVRVEGDGNGVLGILVENARTNIVIQSQDIMDATWGLFFSGVVTPVRTSNQGVAPDGTTTADRLQVPACPTAGHYSVIGQALTATAAAKVASVYVKGYAGSDGGIQIQTNDPGGAGVAKICSYNPDTWTRCSTASFAYAGTGNQVFIGCNNTAAVGGANSGAADVLVWQTDLVDGAYATSPIPTTTAAVTRAVDSASAVLTPAPLGSTASAGGCLAATARCALSTGRYLVYKGNAGAFEIDPWYGATTASAQWYIGSSTTFNSTLARTADSSARWVMSTGASGSLFRICKDGTCQTGSARGADTAANTSATLYLGNYNGTTLQCDGVVSRMQVDPRPTRCE